MKPRQIFVKVAHHATGAPGDVLITLGLGSCVAILLHDRQAKVGGLAHVLLPEPALARDRDNFAKFATTAVPMMVRELAAMGAREGRLEARIVGGASMFTSLMVPGSLNMGERNIRATREALRQAGIPLLGEAVGGDYGRSVRFDVAAGRTVVSSVGKPDVVL
ncbi:chemotaxis protein CheD [Longimicrobium sp.]|uniref:chemotaxis protein CheD n=1 Tax=Longimicrobium sp. TaxID=2029185 RepID=UPI002BE491FE|nr:chemotaxis protein CheD [Longimicrobium sp.]HSU17912.1 chemotaxis protein CheD [Longimicrobium sp.]